MVFVEMKIDFYLKTRVNRHDACFWLFGLTKSGIFIIQKENIQKFDPTMFLLTRRRAIQIKRQEALSPSL